MTNPSIPPGSTGEPVLVNERLWQKWIWKNRELDKAGARKRVRFLQIVLVMAIVGVVVQNYMR